MEYETIQSEYVEYGRNKFIEISKKKVVSENAVFLNISKGYYTPTGTRRYQRGIGFPPQDDIVEGLITKLQSVMSSVTTEEKETVNAPAPEAAGEQAEKPQEEPSPEPAPAADPNEELDD